MLQHAQKARFSFLPGNTGCALPQAKPVLPALLFPQVGTFYFNTPMCAEKRKTCGT
jgi:hypothetical protein